MGKTRSGGSEQNGGKNRPPPRTLDRSERIAHGRAVLERVRERVDELEGGRSGGILGGGKSVTEKTRNKYEDEEITDYAFKTAGVDEADLRVSVQLAKLVERLDDEETADLRDAVVSGWLRLTRGDLPELLKVKDDDSLVAQLKARLAEQI
ncbi:MAG: hypothetical protein J0I06_18025 [Planctomycetes bacterium]|nr:hypothetical protein [Planctomycetota bacterium]